MLQLIGGVALAYACWVALLFVMQRTMLFPGAGRAPGPGGEHLGYERIQLPVPPGEAWLALPPDRQPGQRFPTVIFTHGNGEVVGDWFSAAGELYLGFGVAVLLVEYPGYAGAPGSPTQESIRAAMLATFDALVMRDDVDHAKIVVHGRSLGGGAACLLMRQRPVAAAILESTFTSVADMATRYLVPKMLVRDPFDNASAVAAFDGPILLLHGRRDTLIPFAHSEALLGRARHGTLTPMQCGHNDCPRGPEYEGAIRRFITAL